MIAAILRAAATAFGRRLLGVALVKQPLPLQIAQLHVVPVDDPQQADSGPRQRPGLKASECAATDYRHSCVQQLLLAGCAQAREENLPRITLSIPCGHTIQMVSAGALKWSLVSTRLGLSLSVPMLAAICWIPLSAAPEQYEGKAIASIRFDPERQQLTRDQLLAIIPLQVGKPLLASDVRDSIERLFRTGEYADISVGATLAPRGVDVTFFTKPTYFTGNVAVEGVPEPPNQGELRVATKLQLGTDYTPDDMSPAVERITEVLKRNGFSSVITLAGLGSALKASVMPRIGSRGASSTVENSDMGVPRRGRVRCAGVARLHVRPRCATLYGFALRRRPQF